MQIRPSTAAWIAAALLAACTGSTTPEPAREAGGGEDASLPLDEERDATATSRDAGSDAEEDGSATPREDAAAPDDDASAEDERDAGLVSCDPRKARCKRTPPTCPEFEAPRIVDGCYAECVRIDRCACDGPEACPDIDRFTCHRYAAHCGPYVR